MKKTFRRLMALLWIGCVAIALAGCSQPSGDAGATQAAGDAGIAGDYYLDLTELGMKLTVYLRLDEAGTFLFSNGLSFETSKSAGTYHASDEGYLMVFTSVNGEEQSISEGLSSGFVVREDGALDFGGYGTVPYGTASISTVSADDPEVRLIAVPVPDDYEAPDTETAFQTGTYVSEVEEAGVSYAHAVSFYEDNTYLLVTRYELDGKPHLSYEMGGYGVSTTQLALEPDGGSRTQCEVVDETHLELSILPFAGAEERATVNFTRKDEVDLVASLSGKGTITGSVVEFDVTFELYEDGSYVAVADGYEEHGVIAIDTATEYAKQYPDHPTTGVRGLNQVATVPYAACGWDADGGLTLTDLRVCTSENLTRFKASVAE